MPTTMLEAAFGACAALAVPVLAIGLQGLGQRPVLPAAEMVAIAEQVLHSPLLAREVFANGSPAAAPAAPRPVEAFRIMKRQVSLADYERCVAAGACAPADARPASEDAPVTGVNRPDQDAYARWYSEATGQPWRLPTAEEAVAAGGPFAEQSVPAAHILEGRDRACMSSFTRDGKGSGCASDTAARNPGFRLVLDERRFPLIGSLVGRLRAAMAPASFRQVPRKDH